LPDYSERLLLWEKSKPEEFLYDEEVDLGNLAERYKICGGSVMNVLRHCCLKAISRSSDKIKTEDLLTGINREFAKEGKTGV
jgi:ATP-dependent 26S proteasome regulatory subunit